MRLFGHVKEICPLRGHVLKFILVVKNDDEEATFRQRRYVYSDCSHPLLITVCALRSLRIVGKSREKMGCVPNKNILLQIILHSPSLSACWLAGLLACRLDCLIAC